MKRRYFNCKRCYNLGNTCQECKDRKRKPLSLKQLTEKTKQEIKEGKQKIISTNQKESGVV